MRSHRGSPTEPPLAVTWMLDGRSAKPRGRNGPAPVERCGFCELAQLRRTAANTWGFRDVYIYRVSQEECEILRESVPYVKLYRYNRKHLYPKLNGYGDNGQRSLKL